VNTPSQDMAPSHLAEAARALATRGSGIRCTVLDKAKMEKLGMRGALAVAGGSVHDPVGIHLSYTPTRRAKKRVAVIGKAVTFDSGGLNIKPDRSMVTMKIDMAGAAAVIGLFKALPLLKIPVEVHGIFLAVENMPSGSAYRPGDVVKAMNGTTIEILNTDAEGRVTLADALSYTVKKIQPEMMVDLATLTGAAVVALGEEITPVLGNNPALVKGLLAAAKRAGEDMWELPLYAPYNEAINSKIADINNTGGSGAGTIKAALFLQRFVGDTPWAHLDIAGPSYCEKETRLDVPLGGTGVGVRTLVEWLQSLAL
jgi:leucyl aminopeptidase